MIAAWLLFATATGVVLTVAALAGERVAAALRRPRRHVWLAALAATAVWPAIAVGLAGRRGAGEEAGVLAAGHAVRRLGAFVVPSDGRTALNVDRALLVVWGAAAGVLLIRLALAARALQRRRDAWSAAEVDGVPVRVSSDAGPAVVGLRRMDVVLPRWALSLDRPLRALVLRHEEEHRAARDPYLLLVATVLTALAPWHAALWWQARRLRLAVEVDCDARVLRAHPHRDRYALLLLAIAQRRSARAPLLAPALTEPTSHLDQRIAAMRPTTATAPRTLVSGLVVAAALAVACSVEPPERPTAPPAPAAAKAAPGGFFEFQLARPVNRISGAAPAYPEALREVAVGGTVVAQFVVDTSGRADMSTFKVLRSDHALFTAAVQQVLPEWRFSPAEVAGGRRVKQLVQLPFEFAPGS